MTPSLRNQKKKLLFVKPVFHLWGGKHTIRTNTISHVTEEACANGNGNSRVCDIFIAQHVSRLSKQSPLKEALHVMFVMDYRDVCADSSTYDCLLQQCLQNKSLPEAKLVHAHMILTGFECQDISLGNKLVIMYAKCGSLVDTRQVLDQMPKRNVFSWTVTIAAYSKHGFGEEALALFHQMRRTGIQPNQFTFTSVVPACANLAALKEVHEEIIRSGFQCDVFVGSALVDMYAKCGSIEIARQLFEKMPQRNVVSWNAMIARYAQNGHVNEALKLFQKMPERNVVSWTAMIAGYAQNGHVDEALKLFHKMPERNVVSWNAMIAGYTQNGHDEEALNLFQQMQLEGVKPNLKTFASVLTACANLVALEQGQKIHEIIIRSGFQPDAFVGSAFVDMYAKCGSIESARKLFDKMLRRNVVSWNAMIAGYMQNGHVQEAINLFQKMPERNVASWNSMIAGYTQNGHVDEASKLFQKMPERDVVSWTAMITGYACNGQVDEALKLFQVMPDRNVVSWTAMIAAYTQNGHVDEALKLFLKMPKRNVVSWSTMIAGYVQNGHSEEALKFFREMQLAGVKPNLKTFVLVLPAYANLASLEQGKQIHEEIIRCGFESDVFIGNALVDMYAKCGCIENARNLFNKMPHQDAVSWTTMIAGYAMHGCAKEALKLFAQMQHSGINPDHITFIGVLFACCHAGLVDEGMQYFDTMIQYYHIAPAMEHYGCMVDLLGRAGRLDEAQGFINKMPIKPDATVWKCLLGACRSHNNIELGEFATDRLLELDPNNATPYVLLSNIYAVAGRWDDIEKVRKMMKDRKVKKKPGCSWIEVNKKVYAFLAGERSHPQMQEICA